MKQNIQQKLSRRERRMRHRIDKANGSGQSPLMDPPAIRYELADRVQARTPGGRGVVQQMVKQWELAESINRRCPLFKMRLPYSEADPVLNIAYNLLAGGTCLEPLELRRQDEASLKALGAERIPDPTTAGDFCRRFSNWDILMLSEAFHEARQKVGKQQPDSFFDLAIIEGDGTMVETWGERKEGLGMNSKGQGGYHPRVMTLANTREVLSLANRPGNRPSHEDASIDFDFSIDLCRRVGFRKIRLRGDTDFSQTAPRDGGHEEGVEFVFGRDSMPNLVEIAENLPKSAWKTLPRQQRTSAKPRAKRANTKEQIVVEKEYVNKRLEQEFVAEFNDSPTLCGPPYRVVVLRKHITVTKGQQKLFDDSPDFFFNTNRSPGDLSAEAVVGESNPRCDQENIISQLKQRGARSAPLDTQTRNGAYGVIASLAWNLKAWLALSLTETGPENAKAPHRAEKQRLLRMDFSTFRQTLIQIPTQIIRSARRLIYRLLAWSPGLKTLFRLHECVSQSLLC